jgi:hypothetical protein
MGAPGDARAQVLMGRILINRFWPRPIAEVEGVVLLTSAKQIRQNLSHDFS